MPPWLATLAPARHVFLARLAHLFSPPAPPQAWVKALSGSEADRFLQLQPLWARDQDVRAPTKLDRELRKR